MKCADNIKSPIQRALISVADKTGIVEFASRLVQRGVEILASGGTSQTLKSHSIPVTDVADYTGFPEIMDGRVKTLHPKIHAGILARRGVDEFVLTQNGIKTIDLLVVNLYPFAKTINTPNCTLSQAIENIDVGGPSMLRAGAKNFHFVTVAVDPHDYPFILQEMDTMNDATSLNTRRRYAQKVFNHLSQYDHLIAGYLAHQQHHEFPEQLPISFTKKLSLRYGENPHQHAALYSNNPQEEKSLTNARLLQGKPLSFNNLLDADCAYRCVNTFSENTPACVIIKHATPCGAGTGIDQLQAYENAFATDPVSAFGGIIAFNTSLKETTVKKILENQFAEVIIVPEVSSRALQLLSSKPNLRVLKAHSPQTSTDRSFHTISGGLLIQQFDSLSLDTTNWKVVTKRQPTDQQRKDLEFAWKVCAFVKSNAIVYAKHGSTLGIGGGQTSRVFAAKIAALKAEEANLSLMNSVMASDGFFPFADGVEVAVQAGISAIIQPGGSKRDQEVIDAANKADITMMMTGERHFRH